MILQKYAIHIRTTSLDVSQTCLQGSAIGELQKWPLMTVGLCSERQKLCILFSRDKLKLALWTGNHYSQVPLFTGLTVYYALYKPVHLIG